MLPLRVPPLAVSDAAPPLTAVNKKEAFMIRSDRADEDASRRVFPNLWAALILVGQRVRRVCDPYRVRRRHCV
jgi:hypothetical protein